MKILGAEVAFTAPSAEKLPPDGPPEVALLGRSNVGKSSLLNRLVNRKNLARTSRTPGKTRLVHGYRVRRTGGELLLVDLPGYGYAKVSKDERARWKLLVESYLETRRALRVAVLLQDLRRDLGEDEQLLLAWLEERRIPVLLALTKVDKLKPMRRAARIRELTRQSGLPPDHVVPTSAEKRTGIDTLWRTLAPLL
jgi:GTP-binding protein